MSERVYVHPDTPAIHFAIEALTAYIEKHPDSIPMEPKGYLDVEFKINGVEVPFAENLAEIYRRYEEQIDKEAAMKAQEILELGGLGEQIEHFQDQFRSITWEIKRYICDKLGIDQSTAFGDD